MPKILIIEDDPTLNRNITDALLELHMQVDSVFDGQLAERILRKDTFDCVVIDVNLPYKNGYELCKEFRKFNQDTPVIFLTAFGELEDKVKGFDSGADDYLTKPFFMKELILRIHSLLKRKDNNRISSQLDTTLISGDIVVETSKMKVSRQGAEIALTPREYQILVRLIKAKGELVPKKELIREIWGTSLETNTNTIEVYINFLRKKIDKPFGKDSIKTKIGFGYYFEEE